MLREDAHDAQEENVAEATARQRESFASETLCSFTGEKIFYIKKQCGFWNNFTLLMEVYNY